MPRLRIFFAIALSLGSMWLAQLSVPVVVHACSCVAPQPDAPVFSGEEQAVFIGTARMPLADGTHEFQVERWFKGGSAELVKVQSERQMFPDGSTSINTCGLHFEVGDRLILSASFADGVYTPALCSAHAVVASDEGARLIDAANTAFGPGVEPGGQPPGASDVAFGIDLAAVALGGVGIIVLLAILVTVYAVARRGSAGDEA